MTPAAITHARREWRLGRDGSGKEGGTGVTDSGFMG